MSQDGLNKFSDEWYREQEQVLCIENFILLVALIGVLLAGFGIIDPRLLGALATLILAGITAYTVRQNKEQSEVIQEQSVALKDQADSLREELRFVKRPGVSIYQDQLERPSGTQNIAPPEILIQNIGSVPVDITVQVSLSPFSDTDPSDPILQKNRFYEEIDQSKKVGQSGGDRDWRERHFFLQKEGTPNDSIKRDLVGALEGIIERRHPDKMTQGIYEETYWLRFDVSVRSDEYPDTLSQKFLFKLGIKTTDGHGETYGRHMFSQYSFRQARAAY